MMNFKPCWSSQPKIVENPLHVVSKFLAWQLVWKNSSWILPRKSIVEVSGFISNGELRKSFRSIQAAKLDSHPGSAAVGFKKKQIVRERLEMTSRKNRKYLGSLRPRFHYLSILHT